MIYVMHEGRLVPKDSVPRETLQASAYPTPRLSRIEPYESPVTGKEISSWAERDRDMRAVDAVDLRDYPKDHTFSRGRDTQLKEPKI
jgi:hypothetical protein